MSQTIRTNIENVQLKKSEVKRHAISAKQLWSKVCVLKRVHILNLCMKATKYIWSSWFINQPRNSEEGCVLNEYLKHLWSSEFIN